MRDRARAVSKRSPPLACHNWWCTRFRFSIRVRLRAKLVFGQSPPESGQVLEDAMADESSQLPFLGYAPEDIPKMTSGVISRTRVFEDLNLGRVRAKKIRKRDLITPEKAGLHKNKTQKR